MFNLCNIDIMSRLSIEIDAEQHRQIKTLATFAGLSIKEFILRKTLFERVNGEDATEKLLSSPKNARRLKEAVETPATEHRVFESLKDLENALGI
ncbi:hypothetical protein BSZ32_06235 [Rubritalea profundi]|uniref:Antitoxin n=2 Tax=Rubritalea profundi TaxID=1658618 RepID=A0A2S7TZG4_9BACT|nr:hypothetical protein BSZ32_06235 [Rubritalea profundi]